MYISLKANHIYIPYTYYTLENHKNGFMMSLCILLLSELETKGLKKLIIYI